MEAGYEFIKGDLQATTYNIAVMAGVGMIGGVYASASGIGAGMIFIPALIMIGIESQVAAATGMYLSMFTTLSSTIQMIAHQRVDFSYSLYILLMTFIGTFLGVYYQRWLIKKYRRVSYQNFILVWVFIVAIVATVAANIPIIVRTVEQGQGLFKLTAYCEVSQ